MFKRHENRLHSRIEKAGNDDFGLILMGGPKAYPTHELHVLLRLLRIKEQQVGRIRRWSYALGWLLPATLLLATLAAVWGFLALTYALLAFAPVVLGAMIILEWWQGRVLSVYDRAGELRRIIENELAWRRANAEYERY